METTSHPRDWSKQELAHTIGHTFIAMGLLSYFAEFGVRTRLIDWDSATATLQNILSSTALFESGIAAFAGIILLDAVAAIVFYSLFKEINRSLAFLMASLRLVYIAIKGGALVGLLVAAKVALQVEGIDDPRFEQIANECMNFLTWHHLGFGFGLIFFGAHLLFLAVLVLQARELPKFIGWFLLAAGAGYILNSFAELFFYQWEMLQNGILVVFLLPMMFAELLIALWLMIRRRKLYGKEVPASA